MSDGYVLACGRSAVAIDYWTAPRASAFFLTHMHADHYKGLHDNWRQGTIYCSEVTGLLLQRKWPHLSSKTIPTDEPFSIQLSTDERLTVTAIEANHCPVRCPHKCWALLLQCAICHAYCMCRVQSCSCWKASVEESYTRETSGTFDIPASLCITCWCTLLPSTLVSSPSMTMLQSQTWRYI